MTKRERELVATIIREAKWIANARGISRQASYNGIPDLVVAVREYEQYKRHHKRHKRFTLKSLRLQRILQKSGSHRQ